MTNEYPGQIEVGQVWQSSEYLSSAPVVIRNIRAAQSGRRSIFYRPMHSLSEASVTDASLDESLFFDRYFWVSEK